MWGLEPIPSVTCWETGYCITFIQSTLSDSDFCRKVTVPSQPIMHVNGVWKEARVQEKSCTLNKPTAEDDHSELDKLDINRNVLNQDKLAPICLELSIHQLFLWWFSVDSALHKTESRHFAISPFQERILTVLGF